MNYAKNTPVAYVTVQVDTSKINAFIKKMLEEKVKMSLGDIIVHAVANALSSNKVFNAGEEINIGYHINLGKGTKIAVLKEDTLNTRKETAGEIVKKALAYIREETVEEENPSFVITNLSSFNAFLACPPLYEGIPATLGIGSDINNVCNITLSFDSTKADCQTALAFLSEVKKIAESTI